MLKGIVFDLDGTLVDSLSVTFDGFNMAFGRLGSSELSPFEIMKHFGTGERQIMAAILGDAKADEAYRIFAEHMANTIGNVPMHEGVEEMIEYLRAASVPISIVTGRGWETTQMILNHLGILDHFVTIVAHDHVTQSKPSPEGIHLALSKMNLTPWQVMYVGDAGVDLTAAHAAGSKSVAALWDRLANPDELSIHEPNHWAHKPRDIIDIWGIETQLT